MYDKPTYQELEQRIAELELELQDFRKNLLSGPEQEPEGPSNVTGALSNGFSGHVHSQNAQQQTSELKFRNIVAGSPMGIHLYELRENDQLVFIGANAASDRILGIKHHQFIGKTIEEAFPALIDTEVPTRYRNAARHGATWKTEQIEYHEGMIKGAFEVVAFQTEPGRMAAFFNDITARKKAEIALKESEKKMRSVLSVAPIGIVIVSNCFLLDINERFCEMTGYQRGELIGKNARFLYPTDEDYEFVEREKYRQIRKYDSGTVETRFKRKDGRIINVLMSSTPVDPDNMQSGVTFTVLDITDRQQTEKALRKSEKMYRTLVENASDAILIAQEGELKFANKKARAFSGYKDDELIHQPLEKLIHKDDWSDVRAHHIRRLKGEEAPDSYIFRAITKSGATRWIELHAVVIDWEGKPAALTFLHDITDKKMASEALEKRILALTMPLDDSDSIHFEDLFNLEDIQRLQDEFANATGVASIITHTDGTPITRPSNFCRLCNDIIRKTPKGRANCYHSDAVIGRLSPDGSIIQQCMSGGLWDAGAAISVGGKHLANWLIGQVRDQTQTEETIRAYARIIEADEEEMVEAFREVPEMSQERFKKVAQMLFTLAKQLSTTAYQNVQQARFISERDRAEKEKEYIDAQYRQSQKVEAVGRLAGGVAHDLNNLLSPIIGYGELLLDDFGPYDKRRESIRQIVKAGYGARDLVHQLLAFSRKQTLEYKLLNLNDAIMEFEKLMRRTIREDIDLHIISASDILTIKADIGQIEQVIMNLCVNAQDAMPQGGRLTLETAMVKLDDKYTAHHPDTKPGQYAMLKVSDTGCGMDKETREHIFEPFFSTKGEGGTGLGLATVYGIVKQHGGNIRVDSEPGKGTAINVYLPVSRSPIAEQKHIQDNDTELKGSETILLVEDNLQVRDLAGTILKRQGYKTLAAESGDHALKILATHDGPIDLLLTDVVMPDMNGKDLFKRISEKHPDIKVLYMSGYTGNVIAQRGVLEEGVQFIQKPFTIRGLATRIKEVLKS